jgi:hypothetical protein
MNFKAIFGPVFFSVLAALILYDLVIKSAIAAVMPGNKYDNTYDPKNRRYSVAKGFTGKSNKFERRDVLSELQRGIETRA